MSTIIAAELVCLAFVLFWPIRAQEDTSQDLYRAKDEIAIQAPVITRQQSKPPPPPAPTVPIPVPTDEPVPEQEIEFPEEISTDLTDSLSVTAGEGGDGDDEIAGNPEIGPSVLRIEEPAFENNSDKKADIYINFLVSKKGKVESATVEKILLYDDEDNPTLLVDDIDESVINQTIKAALNWKFRPAKNNGKPVRTLTTHIFTVDY